MSIIPSAHVYRPPTDNDNHLQHHQYDSISTQGHARSSSLISAVSAENDDHSGLLNEHTRQAPHKRFYSDTSQNEDKDRDQTQNRSFLSRNNPDNDNEKNTSHVHSEPLIPQPILFSELPAPGTTPTPRRSRRISNRLYNFGGWGPHVGYEWDIQGGDKRGQNTGLKIWKSWSNAKTEWRIGNRARVLKYYVGGPLLGVFALLILVIIIGLIVYFAKWRGSS